MSVTRQGSFPGVVQQFSWTSMNCGMLHVQFWLNHGLATLAGSEPYSVCWDISLSCLDGGLWPTLVVERCQGVAGPSNTIGDSEAFRLSGCGLENVDCRLGDSCRSDDSLDPWPKWCATESREIILCWLEGRGSVWYECFLNPGILIRGLAAPESVSWVFFLDMFRILWNVAWNFKTIH